MDNDVVCNCCEICSSNKVSDSAIIPGLRLVMQNLSLGVLTYIQLNEYE
jgi:hypothetical protein